jgi:hypothetical protein
LAVNFIVEPKTNLLPITWDRNSSQEFNIHDMNILLSFFGLDLAPVYKVGFKLLSSITL